MRWALVKVCLAVTAMVVVAFAVPLGLVFRELARDRAFSNAEREAAADTAALESRIAADPDDHQARYDLAGALAAQGRRDAAADQLLESIGRDRDWNDGAARQRLLQLLEAVGLEDPWAGAQRRRLSAILFG